jgi:hypothetical protein
MKTTTLSTHQIIDETVKYYRNNPRSVEGLSGICRYLSEDGYMCAVGRCLTKENLMSVHKHCEGRGVRSILSQSDSVLKKKYRGHSNDFWECLQRLHDFEKYWRLDGNLTEEGEDYINKLKKNFLTNKTNSYGT